MSNFKIEGNKIAGVEAAVTFGFKSNPWISVKDRLPETFVDEEDPDEERMLSKEVYVLTRRKRIRVLKFKTVMGSKWGDAWVDGRGIWPPMEVTHWRPIPPEDYEVEDNK